MKIPIEAICGHLGVAGACRPQRCKACNGADCYRERSRVTRRVVTSNFVLDELVSLLFLRLPFAEASKFANAILESPAVVTEMVTKERFKAAMALRLKFADKPKISFTDLTSMVIMKDLGIFEAMTADNHFV